MALYGYIDTKWPEMLAAMQDELIATGEPAAVLLRRALALYGFPVEPAATNKGHVRPVDDNIPVTLDKKSVVLLRKYSAKKKLSAMYVIRMALCKLLGVDPKTIPAYTRVREVSKNGPVAGILRKEAAAKARQDKAKQAAAAKKKQPVVAPKPHKITGRVFPLPAGNSRWPWGKVK